MKSLTTRIILLISLVFAAQTYAEDKGISIDPNKQKVTTEFVENGCFVFDGYFIVKVDGFKMMILQNEQDMAKLYETLNNAKAENKIVRIEADMEKKSYGSNQLFGQTTYCKDDVAKIKKISSHSLDQEKNNLKAKLALCQETIINISTNINMSTGSADYLQNEVGNALSFNERDQVQ